MKTITKTGRLGDAESKSGFARIPASLPVLEGTELITVKAIPGRPGFYRGERLDGTSVCFIDEARVLPIAGVVNLRDDKFDEYIGRGLRCSEETARNIPKRSKEWPDAAGSVVVLASPWRNPFKSGRNAGEQKRAEVIAGFEAMMRRRIKNDHETRVAFLHLSGKTLGCWCRPLSCHGDAMIRIMNDLIAGRL